MRPFLAFFLAAGAYAYDAATVNACRQIPATQMTAQSYYDCCCAKCDCGNIPECARTCTNGMNSFSAIKNAEQLRDQRKAIAQPKVMQGQ